ncbi:MAG TPA: hypothetical protein VGH28_16070 [Polyangiaceae bacterium]|jgi:hypothetical protein
MKVRTWWLLGLLPVAAVAAAACVGDDVPTRDAGPEASTDGASEAATDGGAPDANDAACNLDAPFLPPTAVAGLSALGSVARFSADEKTAYFALAVGDAGLDQLYQATRPTLSDPFGAPTVLANVNDALGEATPFVSTDGKTIFYGHSELGASGRDIWYAARQDTIGAFQNPQVVAIVNDPTHEDDYVSQATSGELWFSSRRDVDSGQNEIFHATDVGNGFGTPQVEAELNSQTESNLYPVLTPDMLRIFFQRGSSLTIWTATRPIPSGPFGTPQVVSELTVDGTIERPSWISADGCRLYVGQGQPVQMLVASRPPN